jgi:tRNA nucleotidyltransferase/poly(A) polymerase
MLNRFAVRRPGLYLAGGAVRDALLGRSVSDADIAVATGSAMSAGRAFADMAGGALVILGNRRLARVHLPGATVDFTPLKGRDIMADLGRRDFTVNAMAVPIPWSNPPVLVDPTGGSRDLDSRRLRLAYPAAFRDDPVRLWRALRIMEEFGLKPDAAFARRFKADARLAAACTPERLRDELFKLLGLARSARALAAAMKSGVLGATFPVMLSMVRVKVPRGGSINVMKHTLEAFAFLEKISGKPRAVFGVESAAAVEHLGQESVHGRTRLSLLKLAVLLHDTAKPACVGRDSDGDVHFIGHEAAGARIAADLMRQKLKCSEAEIAIVTNVIRLHLRPGYLAASAGKAGGTAATGGRRTAFAASAGKAVGQISDRAAYRFIKAAGDELYELVLHAQADRMATHHGRAVTAAGQDRVLARILAFRRKMDTRIPGKRLLTGHDVMREFGIKPGPDVGLALRAVEEGVALGRVGTREEALKAAKRALDRPKSRMI